MIPIRITLLAMATMACPAFAQNDECSGAIFIDQGVHGPFTNIGSTTSFGWSCASGGNDVWFLYVAPGNGTLTIDDCGANFDSAMELFDGAAGCGALTSIVCNDDACGSASSVTASVVAGGTYYLRVGGYEGDVGTFSLSVNGPSGSGTIATATAVGQGCITSHTSFFEAFATASTFDLDNSAMTLVPTNPGYTVVPGGVYVPPSGAATVLNLQDDDEITLPLNTAFPYDGGTTPSLTVCSNGSVWVATGNSTDYYPSLSDMLNAPETGWWCWHDFNPTEIGSGAIKFEQIGSVAYVTWDGVYDFEGTSAADASTFQMQFDSANGVVTIAWQTMSLVGTSGTGFLVGYSPGGASPDPGATDISVVLPTTGFAVGGQDVVPLSLDWVTRPVTGSTWNLMTGDIPATGVIGVDILGLTNPGIADLTAFGMPGCGLYTSLDLLQAFAVGGATHNWGLPVPPSVSLVNVHVYASSAVFQSPPVNAFGAITSNGMDGKIGDL